MLLHLSQESLNLKKKNEIEISNRLHAHFKRIHMHTHYI